MKKQKNIIIGHKITRTLPEQKVPPTSEIRDDKRVAGLRCLNWGGPVKVLDARTGQLKYIVENPPTYYELLKNKGVIKQRVNNHKHNGREN